jgi:plasmid stabilization system protein ParE
MVGIRVLVWDKIALDHLKEIYDSLKTGNNLDFAKEVKSAILKTSKELVANPYIYEQDRFKFDNDGGFRAFVKFKYRVGYKITDTQIRILRVRHTSREPIEF